MSERGMRHESGHVFARNLDWNLLKLFHEIVRSGGITAASRSINKQQPSVSAVGGHHEALASARLRQLTSWDRRTGLLQKC